MKNTMIRDGLLYDFDLDSGETETDSSDEETEQLFEPIFTPIDKIEETEKNIPQSVPEAVSDEPKLQKVPNNADKNELKVQPKKATEKVTEELQPEMLEGFSYLNRSIFENSEQSETETVKSVQPEEVRTEKPTIHAIGEILGLYIIAETQDKKMVIIDKHAAHERIIFERLRSRNCRQYMQMLMTDIKVLLTADEISAMQENTELLADMGFMFDFSESPCIAVKAVPTFVNNMDIEAIISEVAENLSLHVQNPQSHVLDDMLHTVACKSAVRANDKCSLKELQSLAEQVYYDDRIRHCPHGRPVMFFMTENNIAHQFRRT